MGKALFCLYNMPLEPPRQIDMPASVVDYSRLAWPPDAGGPTHQKLRVDNGMYFWYRTCC